MAKSIPDPQYFKPLSALKEWAGNYNEGDIGAILVSIQRFGFNGALRVWPRRSATTGRMRCSFVTSRPCVPTPTCSMM